MKYLVMECHNSYAILLDAEGRFVKAANMHYEVGQTVTNPFLMREPEQNTQKAAGPQFSLRKFSPKLASFTAAAACMMLLFAGVYQTYMVPYTSLVLSINPSVQMDLNRKGNVVELTGLNADGAALLKGYNMSSKDRLVVTNDLIDRAIDMGYLYAGGQIVINIDTPDDALFKQYGTELRTSVNESLAEHIETTETVTVSIGRAIKSDTIQIDDENDTPVQNQHSEQVLPNEPTNAPKPDTTPVQQPIISPSSDDDDDYDDDDSDDNDDYSDFDDNDNDDNYDDFDDNDNDDDFDDFEDSNDNDDDFDDFDDSDDNDNFDDIDDSDDNDDFDDIDDNDDDDEYDDIDDSDNDDNNDD